jgi:hypothetical protein
MSHESVELVLYMENTWGVYWGRLAPVCRNLARKWDRGVFDLDRGIRGMRYAVDASAREYHLEHGSHWGKWFQLFSVSDRDAAAEWLARGFVDDIRSGERWWDEVK